jgi:hypothetical protein
MSQTMIIDIAYVLFHFQKLLLKTEQKKQYTTPPLSGEWGYKKMVEVEMTSLVDLLDI